MSEIDKNSIKHIDRNNKDEYVIGIRHNSFYDTNEDLGIKEKTKEEMMEYKRLIGMPLSEDYDELIASLNTSSPILTRRK